MPPHICLSNRLLRPRSGRSVGLVVCLLIAAAASAQPTSDQPDHPTLSGSAGVAGIGFYQPDRWGLVSAHINNPTGREQTTRLIFRFEDQPQRQFMTNTWLPPHTRRQVTVPVRFGKVDITEEHKTATTETLLTPTDAELEYDRETGLVRLVEDRALTAVMSDNTDIDDEAITVVADIRSRLGLPRGMAFIAAERSIRFDVGWDGVKLLMLSADAPQIDAAQRRSLKRWLVAGGTLLVFADQVENHTMQLLLDDAWPVQVVDQVTLTSIQYQRGPQAATILPGQRPWADPTVETEQPITMTRLLAPGYDTLLQVRGWPALLTRPIGRGRIVVSTLGGRAWTDAAAEPAADMLSGLILPNAMAFATSKPKDAAQTISGQTGQQFVTSRIGYKVISRKRIAMVLGGFLVVMIVLSLLWRLSGRLELLAPVGVVASLAAMGLLITMGNKQRGSVAPTVATIQQITVEPGGNTAQVVGAIGLYDSAGVEVSLAGAQGGWVWPMPLGQTEQLMRLRYEDLDQWIWPQLTVAAGAVRPVQFGASITFEHPPTMDLAFGPEGLVGTINLPGGATLANPIIATQQANLAVHATVVDDVTKLHASAADVLPRGVYIAGGLLDSDEQARAAVLSHMLDHPDFDRPMVMGWADPLDWKLDVKPDLAKTGSALWSIPLSVKHAQPGQQVRVPWPLLSMQQVVLRDQNVGLNLLPIYRPDTKTWLPEISGPSAFVGRFVIPEAVRPLKITAAKVHLDMDAIGRPVRILTLRDMKPVELASIINPSGPQAIDIPVDQLDIDADGGVMIAFDVQNPPNFTPGSAKSSDIWTIRRFGLEVTGAVAEGFKSPRLPEPQTPER
ncbi:hypothetical protein HED60_08855 [Planctomycetales bacterium ZRK34]|nr:hypothetical protein HED60_08855 [Planctomycetales bacterium ZRK34]